MKKLVERSSHHVNGCITGFDRIVFKGLVVSLMMAKGAMNFYRIKGILKKDYKNWMVKPTTHRVTAVDQYAKDNCGEGIISILMAHPYARSKDDVVTRVMDFNDGFSCFFQQELRNKALIAFRGY